MTEETEAPEHSAGPEASPTPETPATDTAARSAITGPRAAAAILVIATIARLVLLGVVSTPSYIEVGLAIALVMSERDARLVWVRAVLLLVIAFGLAMAGLTAASTGAWATFAATLCWAGGLGALTFAKDDLPKVVTLFAVSLTGMLAAYFI